MALTQSDLAKGVLQMPQPAGSEILSVKAKFTVTPASAMVLEVGQLPVDCVPVDWIIDSDDLDSGTTITFDFGILVAAKTSVDTGATSGGAAWLAASTLAQAGGVVRPTTKATFRTAARTSTPTGDTPTAAQLRSVGLAFTGTFAGAQAGDIEVTLFYKAAQAGM